MKRLIKKSEITDGFKFEDEKKYTYIYTNPTASEVEKTILNNKFRSVRGLIYNNGEVFIWPGSILHEEINDYTHDKLNLSQLHFEYMDGIISVYCYHEYNIKDVQEFMKNANSSLKNIISNNDIVDFYNLKPNGDEISMTFDELLNYNGAYDEEIN